MLLNDVKWEKSVTISLENGAPRIFNGVYEAFDFLQHEWPERGGKAHEQALRLCRASLMGDVAGEIARTAFVAASRQAQCLMEDKAEAHNKIVS
ncbi:DUF982 domain-containing protein [Agrobacterium sp. SOY23]|uniref:DUF982 domain-containing protein n=1 Tax=Agrobacterium sp. SOY23 TaxID=3014555 RepID=UPI001B1319AE|nr:DUF982 domain-containing protein [Agrobacterium sp. SOY23]MBO9656592.1 DUF982 domain-containing protein [Agrobacterium tumefaciens]MCZ4430668.1 DUF982 domain-containing protein [Agrobacterium sp. SOY23]